VGSACVDHFAGKGWKIIGIDNNQRAKMFGTPEIEQVPLRISNGKHQIIIERIDIRDEKRVDKLFRVNNFDAIIHAAAQPSHDYATDHVLEDFDINTRGSVLLLEATRKYCPEAIFVHVSTDKVYGENMQGEKLSDENLGLDFAGDRSFFGCSKAAADMYAQQYAARGMTVGIFRPGCITGRNHQGAEQHGFLAYLAKCIKEGITYHIYGTGKQVRDQLHAGDLARVFDCFISRPTPGGVYNMGGGLSRAVSVLEAGRLLSERIGKPFLHDFRSERLGDRRYDVHDVTKFRRDYPEWDYEYDLDAIIKELAS
jgi:CDP-paratose 2-epimerase